VTTNKITVANSGGPSFFRAFYLLIKHGTHTHYYNVTVSINLHIYKDLINTALFIVYFVYLTQVLNLELLPKKKF